MRKFTNMSGTEERINGVEVVDVDEDSKESAEFADAGENEKDKSTENVEKTLENGENEDALENEDGKDDEDEEAENGEENGKKSKKGSKRKAKADPKKKKTPTKPKKKVKLDVEDDEEDEEEEEYEVQDIIDHRTEGKKVFYQIRWKGYGPSGDTWEAEDSLACPDIIKRYKTKGATLRLLGGFLSSKTKSATKAAPKRGAAKAAKGKSPKGKPPAKKGKKAAVVEESEEEDEESEEEAEYEVEKIVDMQAKKNGKREFLVHWKGFSAKDDTWEPEEHLNCKDLISKYTEKLKGSKNATQKESRAAPKNTKRASLPATKDKGGRRLSRRNDSKERTPTDSEPETRGRFGRPVAPQPKAQLQPERPAPDYVSDLFNGYAKMFRNLSRIEQLDCLKLLNDYFDQKLRAKYNR